MKDNQESSRKIRHCTLREISPVCCCFRFVIVSTFRATVAPLYTQMQPTFDKSIYQHEAELQIRFFCLINPREMNTKKTRQSSATDSY